MIRTYKYICVGLFWLTLIYGILATNTGLKVITTSMEKCSQHGLRFQHVQGYLAGDFSIGQLDFSVGKYRWTLKQIKSTSSPTHVWRHRVTIHHLTLKQIPHPKTLHDMQHLRHLAWSLFWIDHLAIDRIHLPQTHHPVTHFVLDQSHANQREFEAHMAPFVHLKAHATYHHHSWHGQGAFIRPPYAAQTFIFDTHQQQQHTSWTLNSKGVLGRIKLTLNLSANQLKTSFDASEMVPWMLPHHVPLQIKNIRATSQVSKHQQEMNIRHFQVTLNHHPIHGHAKIASRLKGLSELDVALYAPTIHDKITFMLKEHGTIQQHIRIHDLGQWMPSLRGQILSDMRFQSGKGLFGFTEVKDFFSKHIQAKSIVIRQKSNAPTMALELNKLSEPSFQLNTAIEIEQNTTLTPGQLGRILAQTLHITPVLQQSFQWFGQVYPQWVKHTQPSCGTPGCQAQTKKDHWRHFEVTSKKIPLNTLKKWLPTSINLDTLKGDCSAHVSVAINIEKPWQVRGEIRLSQLQFEHYASGTRWRQGEVLITLTPTNIDANGHILLNGQKLLLSVKTKTTPRAPVSVHVQGQNIPLTLNPTLKMVITPNVTFNQHHDRWDITGSTVINRGYIRSPNTSSTIALPTNTTIVGRKKQNANLSHYLTQYLKGQLHVTTEHGVTVENLFGFLGQLQGNLTIVFTPHKKPIADGHCQLVNPSYINHPNIHIERANILYHQHQLTNPILDFRLTRNISSIIFDFDHPTQIFDGKKVGLTISGSAMWPKYQLFSDDVNLTQLQIIAALLSGSPHGFSPDQDVIYALNFMNNRPNTSGKPLLSPLQKIRNTLGLDQLYLSTPLEDDNLMQNTLGSTEITMSKSLMANLIATYRVNLSNDDYLLALNVLLQKALKVQLYATRATDNLLTTHSHGLNFIRMQTIT